MIPTVMNFLKKRALWLIVLGCLVIAVFAWIRQWRKMQEQDIEIAALQEQLDDQLFYNKELERRLEYMNSEDYMVDAARDRLGMVKEGEIIYYNLTPTATPVPIATPADSAASSVPTATATPTAPSVPTKAPTASPVPIATATPTPGDTPPTDVPPPTDAPAATDSPTATDAPAATDSP